MKNIHVLPKEEPKLTNVCIKCGVDLYYADNFSCQEHPKNCKGIHLSEETLKERALKEELKQETTLEEAAENYINNDLDLYESLVDGHISYHIGMDLLNKLFIEGAKWQQEQDKKLYSEEEVLKLLLNSEEYTSRFNGRTDLKHWFEQNKKK